MNRLTAATSACLMLALPLIAGEPVPPDCEERILAVGGPCLEGTAASESGALPRASRQILGFRLGKHSFEAAQVLFGNALRWHSGDAAASEQKLCFVARAGAEEATLVLSANSEMSRGQVDGMTLIGGRTDFSERCLSLATRNPRDLKTDSGISIGMSAAQLKRILGPPTEIRGDYVFYTYCSEKSLKPTDPGYANCKDGDHATVFRCSGLMARFENDKLRWVEFGSQAHS